MKINLSVNVDAETEDQARRIAEYLIDSAPSFVTVPSGRENFRLSGGTLVSVEQDAPAETTGEVPATG